MSDILFLCRIVASKQRKFGADPEELASEIFSNLQRKSYGKQILDFFVVDNTKSGSKEGFTSKTRK